MSDDEKKFVYVSGLILFFLVAVMVIGFGKSSEKEEFAQKQSSKRSGGRVSAISDAMNGKSTARDPSSESGGVSSGEPAAPATE